MTWLSIKNWGSFQHYKDRRPPWIKLYEELLDDPDLANLGHTAQVVYFRLLLVACRRDNQIPHNIAWLAEETNLSRSAVTSGLHALTASGFAISHASKPASGLASASASTRARTHSREAETEREAQPLSLSEVELETQQSSPNGAAPQTPPADARKVNDKPTDYERAQHFVERMPDLWAMPHELRAELTATTTIHGTAGEGRTAGGTYSAPRFDLTTDHVDELVALADLLHEQATTQET